VFFEICARQFIRAPVARHRRKLAHHQSLNERLSCFVILDVGSVIANLRVGEDDNLAGVGRIGENFLIAGHGRIENDLAGPLGGRTKTLAFEDRAVFQGQDRSVQ
jgi:hypothetical protein